MARTFGRVWPGPPQEAISVLRRRGNAVITPPFRNIAITKTIDEVKHLCREISEWNRSRYWRKAMEVSSPETVIASQEGATSTVKRKMAELYVDQGGYFKNPPVLRFSRVHPLGFSHILSLPINQSRGRLPLHVAVYLVVTNRHRCLNCTLLSRTTLQTSLT
jgi:hypothetical protein